MTATTVDRVPRHTSPHVNWRIEQETADRVRYYAADPAGIGGRLRELDEEWDIERLLETNASALAFTGVALSGLVDKCWLVLPALVTAFLFQHAVQGWCPPVPILRRLGYRRVRSISRGRRSKHYAATSGRSGLAPVTATRVRAMLCKRPACEPAARFTSCCDRRVAASRGAKRRKPSCLIS
jgi:hypothetical protein